MSLINLSPLVILSAALIPQVIAAAWWIWSVRGTLKNLLEANCENQSEPV